jgi:hypothetical protein
VKLIDLIKANNWPDVSKTLLSLYPDENKNIIGYKKIFSSFMDYDVVISDSLLVIKKTEEGPKEDHYTDVYSLQYDPDEQRQIDYSITLSAWNELLGTTISDETLNQVPELEIICHCLYNMTFYGFTEKKIQKFRIELEKSANEIENMSPEETEKNRIRSEKFMKKIRMNSQ